MKTFIHHDGALGDVLLSLPSIRAIRDGYGSVHLAGRPDVMRFLKEAGAADESSSSESVLYAPLYAGCPDARLKDFLGQFDRVFVFTVRECSPVVAAMRGIVPKTRVVITIPSEGTGIPVAEFRLKQVGCEQADAPSPLNIPSSYTEEARELIANAGYSDGRPLVALHPGSGGKAKRWPLENYLELAERLKRDQDPCVLIFSGPAEGTAMREKVEDLVRGHKGMAHVADSDIATVAALLHSCDLYIGNDSGVTHLAAAMGSRVVVLFGASDPVLWRPVGPKVQVVAAVDGALSTIGIEEVYATVKEHLGRGKIG
jgi:ADP-heptose:LPS heptosyltransferase